MDSQGRNVIVCDNGTGVSCLLEIRLFFNLGWVFSPKDNKRKIAILVCEVRICWEQLSSSYLPLNGGSTDNSSSQQDRRH